MEGEEEVGGGEGEGEGEVVGWDDHVGDVAMGLQNGDEKKDSLPLQQDLLPLPPLSTQVGMVGAIRVRKASVKQRISDSVCDVWLCARFSYKSLSLRMVKVLDCGISTPNQHLPLRQPPGLANTQQDIPIHLVVLSLPASLPVIHHTTTSTRLQYLWHTLGYPKTTHFLLACTKCQSAFPGCRLILTPDPSIGISCM